MLRNRSLGSVKNEKMEIERNLNLRILKGQDLTATIQESYKSGRPKYVKFLKMTK